MLIVIPSDFETSRTVHVETYNVNTDAMKNAELRLEHATMNYQERAGSLDVVPNISPTEPAITVWRSAFFSGSADLLALFFGATFTAANLFTLEIERQTEPELLLPVDVIVALDVVFGVEAVVVLSRATYASAH